MDKFLGQEIPEKDRWQFLQDNADAVEEIHPDCCDYNGLTAPYPNSFGEMTMYKDGIRYEEDDDSEEFIICENEEEFKRTVIELLNR